MHLSRIFLFATTLGTAFTGSIQAQPFDPSFTAWLQAGDVSSSPSGIILTNDALSEQDDYPAPAGTFNFSGLGAIGAFDLEQFLGLAGGALDPDPENFVAAFEGSAIVQTFNVQAGDSLSFDWNFLTNDTDAGAFGNTNDYAFLLVGGSRAVLAAVPDASLASSVFALETGWQTFTQTFTSAGEVSLALGVVDVGDFGVSSALQLANFSYVAVPEPSVYGLLAGVLTLGAALRRSRRSGR